MRSRVTIRCSSVRDYVSRNQISRIFENAFRRFPTSISNRVTRVRFEDRSSNLYNVFDPWCVFNPFGYSKSFFFFFWKVSYELRKDFVTNRQSVRYSNDKRNNLIVESSSGSREFSRDAGQETGTTRRVLCSRCLSGLAGFPLCELRNRISKSEYKLVIFGPREIGRDWNY